MANGRTGATSLQDFADAETRLVKLPLDDIYDAVVQELEAHNLVVSEMISSLVETGTEREVGYGGKSDIEMREIDDMGNSRTQKSGKRYKMGFPLRKLNASVGWNKDAFLRMSVKDLQKKVLEVQTADLRELRRRLTAVIFKPISYTDGDIFGDNLDVTVKPFHNGDSDEPTPNPFGGSFTGPHNHIFGSATLTGTLLDQDIANLLEHGHGSQVRILVNRTDLTTFQTLPKFYQALPSNIVPAAGTQHAVGNDEGVSTDNKFVGVYDFVEVHSRAYIPAGYYLITDIGDSNKPLYRRVSTIPELRGLHLAANSESHPIFVKTFDNYYGLGVKTRSNGVIRNFTNAVYTEPTVVI